MLNPPPGLPVIVNTQVQGATNNPTANPGDVTGTLEEQAQRLAHSHTLLPQAKSSHSLLTRLPEQSQRLQRVYDYFRHDAPEEVAHSQAAEWLLDNYYVVQQTIRQVEEDLPHSFYRQLPKLNSDTLYHFYPRIYALAREIVLWERCQLEIQRIEQFARAYQQVQPLTMGEVWALPIMLRLCLLETLTQVIGRVSGLWADDETDEIKEAALDFRFNMGNVDIIANCMVALRLLAGQDWLTFFEDVSLVEQALRLDAAGLYAHLEFQTRDHYRKIVEEVAAATGRDEVVVAEVAVRLTGANGNGPVQATDDDHEWQGLELSRRCHVGYYLLDQGRPQLEQQVGYRPGAGQRWQRWLRARATFVYLGSLALITLALMAGLVNYGRSAGGGLGQLILMALLSAIPASAVAVSLVNWVITHLTTPQVLPKLDFKLGIAPSCRTMVVVPALLTSPDEVESLLKQLELHYLRNPDPHLGFALLSDYADAPQGEATAGERALLEQAQQGILALNERYAGGCFYLFHRRRLWNPREGVWMGWERKRGKLHEFNRLLRGAGDTSYVVTIGEPGFLLQVRYVITLDADTVLAADSARRLVGTLAHPLNRAEFDARRGKVVAGYTILQPRTEIRPSSAQQSLFTRVFAGDIGLDLYSLAVSDVYQDLFGEGIYVGKGIYDVDAFERSLAGQIPENRLLSHDLLEGLYGRAGLVTDIVLYEEYPPHYLVYVRRSHRWIRGDWQLLPWLFSLGSNGNRRLSLLERWKIADNLRRSLVAPSLFAFLVAGWLGLPGSPLVWTVIGLLMPATALVTSTAVAFMRRMGGASGRETRRTIRNSAIRWLLQIVFLPYEALLTADAIITTLWRLFVLKRQLLQWTTAAHTARLFGNELSAKTTVTHMIPSVLLVLVVALLLIYLNPAALLVAAPVIIAWLLASEIAHWISRPDQVAMPTLDEAGRQRLHGLARRTWLFFEQYVGPEDNWLPPDHFQEAPRGVVAHRTSPTNMGLYLVSALAAYDLGYIGALNLSLRLRSTFDTLARLERYRGHFLNWIDTRTLHPLTPRYVSTVDSGNLAACLLVLKQGCLEMKKEPLWRWQRWHGLLDTLALISEAAKALGDGPASVAVQEQLTTMRQQIEAARNNPDSWPALVLHLLEKEQPELELRLLKLVELTLEIQDPDLIRNVRVYLERLRLNVQGMEREVALLFPWRLLPVEVPEWLAQSDVPPVVLEAWQALQQTLGRVPNLDEPGSFYREAEAQAQHLQAAISEEANQAEAAQKVNVFLKNLLEQLAGARMAAEALLTSYELLAHQADEYVAAMDFSFLFNQQRQVFHIGYNLDGGRLDNNFYDLLASEARIASIIAIAKRRVPPSHWLHLSRPLTEVEGGLALLSWSGTMFEYLMPPLFMNSYRGTLLEQSGQMAVSHQIAYGRQKNAPWGISESGFYTFDNAQNYQYRAFGVPGLGYKRGLAEDLVVAPYASLMALSIQPEAVLENLEHLVRLGMLGAYGLYEAIDFTPSRLELGQEAAVVRSYMSHHQGMIFLSLANYLQNDRMVRRFHTEPSIQSVELLLQEQIPLSAPLETLRQNEEAHVVRPERPMITADPWRVPVSSPMPLVHYLSNGKFGSLITNSGGGYLSGSGIAYTRWRPDTTLDDWGIWLYLQDQESGAWWSAGLQPTGVYPADMTIQYFPHMAQFHRRDHDVSLHMGITVAPDENVELRRISLTNESDGVRRLRLTTYGEVVLADLESDSRHPAFSKLFVSSDYLPEFNLLLFRRRPRSAQETPRYLGHMLVLADGGVEPTQAYESDRARFLGRNHTSARPLALAETETENGWLSGTAGATLDPVMALGQELQLEPHGSVEVALVTFTANSRAEMMRLAQDYQRWANILRTFDQARSRAERELRQLDMPVAALEQAQQLLSLLLYSHPALRAEVPVLAANQMGQSGLWAFSISGDYPILLVRIDDEQQADLLHFLLRAHKYWRRRGLKIDLVIVNQRESQYDQPVQEMIHRAIEQWESAHWLNRRGGLFVLRRDQLGREADILLQTAARVIVDGSAGPLAEQLGRLLSFSPTLPDFSPTLAADGVDEPTPPLPRPTDLHFDNGYGGFSADGEEYVIYLEPGKTTPAPWSNVVANPDFGFLVTESGGGATWAVNSGENRLTPWSNDPVADGPAEVLYLRDEETAEVWTPTPQPVPSGRPYLVRHGMGYTTFEHHSHHLKQRLRLFVAADAPVKIAQLRLENTSERPRRITATYYAEWVLGTRRDVTQPFVIPVYHRDSHAMLARNPYNTEFGEAVAFVAASQALHGLTADRTEFLGRLGSVQRPAALGRIGLNGRVEAGLDSCAALQLHLDLPAGGCEEIYFLIGQGQDEADALSIIQRFQEPAQVEASWVALHHLWDEILGTVVVKTPDPAMNLLLNHWLLYQALACRLWGRSALYQSSGAYGFRDQLQDVMAFWHTRPELARDHLLRAARHQFEAGDVLHWWHPPSGRGVRTRISDDLAWLPYVTAHYVKTTGDESVLDETVPFLVGKPLEEEEEERYGHYEATQEGYSLFEHCCRALERAVTSGRHGLPLMGGGDWNDGMNRVGIEGEGESVWLGWFLYETLNEFAGVCKERGEDERAAGYCQEAEAYRQAIEAHAWDGAWYRRAYYDDGAPLGSSQNNECRIDALAQSWGVLSGAAEPARARTALDSVRRCLVNEADQLILLLTPPFDRTPKDPGYIKGYLPGIRENGGQYTHAALWTIWAYAELGDGDMAERLYRLINPIYRADTLEKADQYKVEPYVISADVYGVAPHEGRGGWTWYTGSSGWMYRLGLEGILGVRRSGSCLRLKPCVPRGWREYQVTYRYGRATYDIIVRNPHGVNQGIEEVRLDGRTLPEAEIPLENDGQVHQVEVILGGG